MFTSQQQAKRVSDNARTGYREAKANGNTDQAHRFAQQAQEAQNYLRSQGWGK
jgi:hypothetical protein